MEKSLATFTRMNTDMGDQRSDQAESTLNDWATWMRAQSWTEATIRERLIIVRRVAREANVLPVDLSKTQLLAFLAQQSFADTTRQNYYKALKAFFAWAVDEEELRADNPMEKIRKPAAGRKAKRYLSIAHVEALLASRMHRRTRAMILLMAYQGLRAFEVAKFRGSDIDRVSRELVVLGKGGVLSVLPLHPVVEALADQHGDGWWFPQHVPNSTGDQGGPILGRSVSNIVSAAMRRAGVPGTAHSLRHWHATTLLAEGLDSRITQELMRHATLATTQRYLGVDDKQRRAGLLLLPDVTSSPIQFDEAA